MKIKNATRRNRKEIARLMLDEFSRPPYNEKTKLNAVLKSLDFYFSIGTVFVSIVDRNIVGVIVFKVEQYWEGPVILVEDLAVQERYEKKGITRSLMYELEEYANKNKMGSIYFNTNKKSVIVKFYKKLGYSIRKDIISMEKKL